MLNRDTRAVSRIIPRAAFDYRETCNQATGHIRRRGRLRAPVERRLNPYIRRGRVSRRAVKQCQAGDDAAAIDRSACRGAREGASVCGRGVVAKGDAIDIASRLQMINIKSRVGWANIHATQVISNKGDTYREIDRVLFDVIA